MKHGMRLVSCIFLVALGVLALGAVRAPNEPLGIVQLTPDEIEWSASQISSRGLRVVVLAGDPKKPVLYTARIKIPANFIADPHWHAQDRMVTVLSGTLHYGYGDTFDEARLKAMPPGSFFTEPAKQPHFAWAKSGDVIVQVTAVGPTGTTPVQPPSGQK